MIAYALNLTDLILTIVAVKSGLGSELNPLMRSIPIMVGYKLIVVGVLCWWLDGRSKWGMRLCAAVYGGLCVYHLYFIL